MEDHSCESRCDAPRPQANPQEIAPAAFRRTTALSGPQQRDRRALLIAGGSGPGLIANGTAKIALLLACPALVSAWGWRCVILHRS